MALAASIKQENNMASHELNVAKTFIKTHVDAAARELEGQSAEAARQLWAVVVPALLIPHQLLPLRSDRAGCISGPPPRLVARTPLQVLLDNGCRNQDPGYSFRSAPFPWLGSRGSADPTRIVR